MTLPRPATRTRARMAAGTAALVVATLGAGCSRPHVPTLSNGSVSACYRAIPPASAAVHEAKAKLLGVHRVSADKVTAHLPAADRLGLDQDTTVCAVAWQGTFAAGQVTGAPAGVTGRYAIVLVNSRHLTVFASYVVNTLPQRLRGRFV